MYVGKLQVLQHPAVAGRTELHPVSRGNARLGRHIAIYSDGLERTDAGPTERGITEEHLNGSVLPTFVSQTNNHSGRSLGEAVDVWKGDDDSAVDGGPRRGHDAYPNPIELVVHACVEHGGAASGYSNDAHEPEQP